MTQAVQVYAPTEMWQGRELALIKSQIAPKHSDEELLLFFKICKHTGLDPFTKQIYSLHRGGKQSIETSINGYRLIAHQSEAFAGIDEAEYDTEDADHPNWARVTVYRMVQGQRVPFTAKVRWDEFGKTAVGPNWKSMPYHMLAKVAESHALRKAFQERLTAIYTSDEMDQVGYVDATAITITEETHETTQTTQAPRKTLTQLQAEIAALCEQFGINPKIIQHWAKVHSLKNDIAGCSKLIEYLNDKDSRARPYVYTWGVKHLFIPETIDRLFNEVIQHNDGIDSWQELWQRIQGHEDEWAVRLKDIIETEEQNAQY